MVIKKLNTVLAYLAMLRTYRLFQVAQFTKPFILERLKSIRDSWLLIIILNIKDMRVLCGKLIDYDFFKLFFHTYIVGFAQNLFEVKVLTHLDFFWILNNLRKTLLTINAFHGILTCGNRCLILLCLIKFVLSLMILFIVKKLVWSVYTCV